MYLFRDVVFNMYLFRDVVSSHNQSHFTHYILGFKSKTAETDLSSILPEDVEEEVKAAAEISMGTDVSEEDIANVSYLCEQIIQISEYRMTLYDYLKNRMQAIAPNLTILVGELVGARLIAHAGLLNNVISIII